MRRPCSSRFSFLSVRPRCFSFHDSTLLISTQLPPCPSSPLSHPPRFLRFLENACHSPGMYSKPHFISSPLFSSCLSQFPSNNNSPDKPPAENLPPNPKIVHEYSCPTSYMQTYLAPDLSEASTSAASSQSRAGPHPTSSIFSTHSFLCLFLFFFSWGQLLQTRYKFALPTNRTSEVPELKSDSH